MMGRKNLAIERLRGLAVLCVWLSHAAIFAPPSALTRLMQEGWGGVQLFFVISGYVVTKSLLRSPCFREDRRIRAAAAARAFGAFYLRRAFRIVPLAVAGVLLAIALRGSYSVVGCEASLGTFWREVQQIAALRQNYALGDGVSHHPLAYYWSLMVEEHFYLALPLILFLVPSRRARFVLLAAVVAGTALVFRPLQAEQRFTDFSGAYFAVHYSTHLAVDFLAAGALLAMLAPELSGGRPWADRLGRRSALRLAAGAVTLGAGAVVLGLGRAYDGSEFGAGMPLLLLASTWLVLRACLTNAAPGGLVARAGVYLGSRSYAGYLLHFPILLTAVARTNAALPADAGGLRLAVAYGGAAIATLAASEVVYRVLEAPAMRLGRRLAGRLAPEGAEDTSPTSSPAAGRGAA